MEIGDRVKVKKTLKTQTYDDVGVSPEMLEFKNKEAVITQVMEMNDHLEYHINIDKEKYFWTDGMLDKIKSKMADNITIDMSEMVDAVKKLTEKIDKRTLYDESMQESVKKKVEDISVDELTDKVYKKVDNYIRKEYGMLPTQKIEINNGEVVRELNGLYHNKFEEILKIVQKGVPVMLTGPAGAGKNHTLEQVAKALGYDFYFTNAVTQEFKLTGFIDANGKYQETQFYKAFKDGGLFFLDEVDASTPEALVILNAAIANGYFDFPCGRVDANPNFRVVCAGNTYGTGADMVYVGRNVLDGATLDRFVTIEFNYDENIEKQLAYDSDLYDFINALRNAIDKNSLRYIISMRATINATKLLEVGMSKKNILISAIIKNMQIDDLNVIVRDIKCHNEWTEILEEIVNARN